MSFDGAWFDELRKLNRVELARVPFPEGPVPTVFELATFGVVSQEFLMTTMKLVRALGETKYPFSAHFRACERHITNFPHGRSYRKQWNIGFAAGETPEDDYARIGLGFKIGLFHEESGRKGADEYLAFIEKIRQNPRDFDVTFQLLGNYTEPATLSAYHQLSSVVLADKPHFHDDWRFFGKKLRFSNIEDRNIMASIDNFVIEAAAIFDHINNCGFY